MKKLIIALSAFAVIMNLSVSAKEKCKKKENKFSFELHINTGRDTSSLFDYAEPAYCNPVWVIAPRKIQRNYVIVNPLPMNQVIVVPQTPSYVLVNPCHSFWY